MKMRYEFYALWESLLAVHLHGLMPDILFDAQYLTHDFKKTVSSPDLNDFHEIWLLYQEYKYDFHALHDLLKLMNRLCSYTILKQTVESNPKSIPSFSPLPT